ncbi:hypothetical protein ACQPTN_28595 [Bradyrhizobium sp. 13971]
MHRRSRTCVRGRAARSATALSRCLDEAAAAGLNQAERAAYSRSCANHRD